MLHERWVRRLPGSHKLWRGAVATLTGAILCLTLLMTTAGPAAAASCSGGGCNGLDPYATGCAQGAYEVTSAGRFLQNPYGGTNGSVVHLFWSPSCQTNWAVVTQPGTCSDVLGTAVWANVTSLSTGQTVSYVYQNKTAPTYVWGNMVYSPGPAQAYGDIDCNGSYDYRGYSGVA
jgi:hypothetical protein